jgi:hypothetical protein
MISRLTEAFIDHNQGKKELDTEEDPLPESFEDEGDNGQQNGINARHRKMAVYGLLRVQMAMQNVLKPKIIKDSFKVCGIYPLSLEQMMKQCTADLSPQDEEDIRRVLPTLVEIMKLQGEIFEQDFDDIGVKPSAKKNTDRLVVSRRRGCILTGKEFVEREEGKRMANQQKKEANLVQKAARKRKRDESNYNSSKKSRGATSTKK